MLIVSFNQEMTFGLALKLQQIKCDIRMDELASS